MSIRLILLIVVPVVAGGLSYAIRCMFCEREGDGKEEMALEPSAYSSPFEAIIDSLSTFELYCLGLAGLGLLLGVAKGVFYLVV
jgi:hypothetical protein